MSLEAARYLASGELGTLGLTPEGFELASWSLEQGEPDVYARFDLAYAGDGSPAKLLEYNGDTPTGLIEASVTQWHCSVTESAPVTCPPTPTSGTASTRRSSHAGGRSCTSRSGGGGRAPVRGALRPRHRR